MRRSCGDAKRCEGALHCTIAQNLDRAIRRPVYFTKIWVKLGPFRYRSVHGGNKILLLSYFHHGSVGENRKLEEKTLDGKLIRYVRK